MFHIPVLLFTLAASGYGVPVSLQGSVSDQAGEPVQGARVVAESSSWQARTVSDERGHFRLAMPGSDDVRLIVDAPGFARVEQPVPAAAITRVQRFVLFPAPWSEQVSVTATRTASTLVDTPASVAVVGSDVLRSAAAPVLDAALRQVPGFTLFRRSDSRTANPTSQGVSLRGLGASGASRALVLDDGVPLNDPFGGWVQWDRVPILLLDRAEVMLGGGSDLYGSGALGGVVNLIRRTAATRMLDADAAAGGLRSRQVTLLAGGRVGVWTAVGTGDAFTTSGYEPVAAAERGAVDKAADSRHAVVDVSLQRATGWDGAAFVRGSMFVETRGNGTPEQRNDTRLGQVAAGGHWAVAGGGAELRTYASSDTFNQTFSAVLPDRTGERLTGTQRVPARALGGSVQWSRAVGFHALVTGFDFRQTAGTTLESTPGGRTTSFADRGGRQRSFAIFAGDTVTPVASLSIAAGIRGDRWVNDEGHDTTWTTPNPAQQRTDFAARTESAISPRLSAVYHLGSNIVLTGSAYRAFRAPTLNELYRSFRVGNVVTQANTGLRAERVSGVEAGVRATTWSGRVYASGRLFWMDMTQPVANVTIGALPGVILRQRQNLGTIRSRGAEVEVDARLLPGVAAHAAYLFDVATVTSFTPNPDLVGRMVPQQPRHGATLRVEVVRPRFATMSVQARWVGEQFDDDLNQFVLAPYGAIDCFVSRRLTEGTEVYVAGENLTNREYEIAKTPVTMIGWPRTVRVGFRVRVGR